MILASFPLIVLREKIVSPSQSRMVCTQCWLEEALAFSMQKIDLYTDLGRLQATDDDKRKVHGRNILKLLLRAYMYTLCRMCGVHLSHIKILESCSFFIF